MPPRVDDYEQLDKKAIDVLVDALKYIATSSGIIIAMYSQGLHEYLKDPNTNHFSTAQLLVFSPILCWFGAITGTVLGIYPRTYIARTELDKERAIQAIRQQKKFWLKTVLALFLLGIALFVYVVAAQIWGLYPFPPVRRT